jgi:hypothetical protein
MIVRSTSGGKRGALAFATDLEPAGVDAVRPPILLMALDRADVVLQGAQEVAGLAHPGEHRRPAAGLPVMRLLGGG